MKNTTEHIYPIFDRLLQKEAKEKLLNQKGKVFWLTGLSGSGKSTIAQYLEKRLFEAGFFTQILDGDNIRSGLNNNLGFSAEDRTENIRRISEVAKLFGNSGIVTIASFISPTRLIRGMAKEIIGATDFFEIFIDTPLAVCEARDVKGLYAKARSGVIKNFTGIDAPYEAPDNPAFTVFTKGLSVEESAAKLFEFVLSEIKL